MNGRCAATLLEPEDSGATDGALSSVPMKAARATSGVSISLILTRHTEHTGFAAIVTADAHSQHKMWPQLSDCGYASARQLNGTSHAGQHSMVPFEPGNGRDFRGDRVEQGEPLTGTPFGRPVQKFSPHNLSHPKMAAPSAKRLLSQVEFYFSDRNLAKDDFFREEIGKEDG